MNSFAIVRYNHRTFQSGGVVAVVKGQAAAQKLLLAFESSQGEKERHAGWRYFLEETNLTPGMDALSGFTAVLLFTAGWVWYYVTIGWRLYLSAVNNHPQREFFSRRYRMTSVTIFTILYFVAILQFVPR